MLVDWEEFVSQDKDDIRDGMSPEDYVRNLRDLDRKEVMSNPEWVVHAVEIRSNYILRLWFEDGSVKDFDCKDIFSEKPFEPLQDISFFSKAHVFADTVAWSDEIDIAPEYLYEHGENVN